MRTVFVLVLSVLLLFVFCDAALALATEQFGPDPPNRQTVSQPEWPKGIAELARHPSRVYSFWVNGDERFHFKGSAQDLNELQELFGQVRMRDHEIRVVPGTGSVSSLQRERKFEHNVCLHIVTGIALFHVEEQLAKGNQSNLPLQPLLTIYSGPDNALLRDLKWPTNAIIDCQVPGVSIPSPKSRPVRSLFHGQVEFKDGSYPEDFVRSGVTWITLWERGNETGIPLTRVNLGGRFSVTFSAQEMADLREGNTWITVTAGNWGTKPRASDGRFPADRLASTPEEARPVTVASPPVYYGQILFEDGTPPLLDPVPWPGARIRVDFAYAGWCEPDAEGYFKVILTPEQMSQLKEGKPRKNVYIPSYKQSNRSSLEFIFPVSLLSETKENAGLLKIPRPGR